VGRYYVYLYLDPEGGGCILGSPDRLEGLDTTNDGDSDENEGPGQKDANARSFLSEIEEKLNVGIAEMDKDGLEITLCATNFEDFVARIYFREWVWYSISRFDRDDTLDGQIPRLKEYLVKIFSEKGRRLA
jgi:hypothetical protein